MDAKWCKTKMAESFWKVRAHGVSEARVHGVSRAHVHGVRWERKKNSGSVGIFQGKAISRVWKVGKQEDG